MTGQAMARINGVTADVGPAPGSAWQPARPGLPRPLEAGRFTLVTLPTSPVLGAPVYPYVPALVPRNRPRHSPDGRIARLGAGDQRGAVRRRYRTHAAILRARQREPDSAVAAAFPRAPA